MTTESRPWKKYVTKGEWVWKISKGTEDCGSFESQDGDVICWFGDSEQFYPTSGWGPTKADRKLILEASRVLHQTGMTPGELAERVRELEELQERDDYPTTTTPPRKEKRLVMLNGWSREGFASVSESEGTDDER
jgi:hypothetical protein